MTVSYRKWQRFLRTHYVKEVLGLNPLLVTYNGNNYTDIGWETVEYERSI